MEFHTVVGAGEYTEFGVVKELLREDGNLHHSTGAGKLRTQLVVVGHRVKRLEQAVVDGATVLCQ